MADLIASSSGPKIEPGSVVTLHFSLLFPSGEEIDTTRDSDPATFTVGDGSLLPGFERRLFGMSAGQRQLFTVPPEDAFGQPNENNVQDLPRRQFEDEGELAVGLVYSFADAGGGELPGMIIALDEEEVTVDFNHPLAGRTILFDALVHRVEAAELH